MSAKGRGVRHKPSVLDTSHTKHECAADVQNKQHSAQVRPTIIDLPRPPFRGQLTACGSSNLAWRTVSGEIAQSPLSSNTVQRCYTVPAPKRSAKATRQNGGVRRGESHLQPALTGNQPHLNGIFDAATTAAAAASVHGEEGNLHQLLLPCCRHILPAIRHLQGAFYLLFAFSLFVGSFSPDHLLTTRRCGPRVDRSGTADMWHQKGMQWQVDNRSGTARPAPLHDFVLAFQSSIHNCNVNFNLIVECCLSTDNGRV